MRHVKLDIRRVAFLAAVVVAVVVAASLAPGARQAYAANIEDPTGVFCADITVTLPGPVVVEGIILARFDYVPGFDFDPDTVVVEDTAISAVAYAPEAAATCQTVQSTLASEFTAQSAARPSLTGIWVNGTDTITGSTCAFEVEFAGITLPGFTRIDIDFELDKGIKSDDANAFSFTTVTDCGPPIPVGGTPLITVAVLAKYLDGPVTTSNPVGGEPIASFNSDWDKDGCLDWNELDPDPKLLPLDPFNPGDCAPGVGGIAELPAVAGTALEAGSSDSSAGLIAAAAAASAAGALALGSAAQYARRRIR